MCTAMLFDPAEAKAKIEEQKIATQTVVTPEGELHHLRKREFQGNLKLFERWVRFKQFVLLRGWRKEGNGGGSSDKKNSILSLFFFW